LVTISINIRRAYLGRSILNLTLVGYVALVPNQQLVHTLAGIAVNLLEPGLDIAEGFSLGYVVDDDDSVGAPIVAGGDRAEAFLASSIPLQNVW